VGTRDRAVGGSGRQRDRALDRLAQRPPVGRQLLDGVGRAVGVDIGCGMIAPRVGMTDPTVAPMPRWASGISARWGWMNGIVAAVIACSRVLSSRIDAQLTSVLVMCSMVLPMIGPAPVRGQSARLGSANPVARGVCRVRRSGPAGPLLL
jgi:hypothetical protein